MRSRGAIQKTIDRVTSRPPAAETVAGDAGRVGDGSDDELLAQADALVAAGQTPQAAVVAVAPPPSAPRPAPKVKVSAAEMRRYDQFRQRGHSHEEAVALMQAQRDLATRLGTPTSEQMRQGVAERNVTGRWPE